jgi:hypothetical protein
MSCVQSARRGIGFALLLGVASLVAGCTEELGPVSMPVTRVQGIVREGDRPVSGGWIEFIPTDGAVGNLRSARLQADGKFDADGVAVGVNAIRLVNARIGTVPVQRNFASLQSIIRRTIKTQSADPLDINLVEEARRLQQVLSRSAAGAPLLKGERP